MTKEEIEIQKALGTYLSVKWKECLKLCEEGHKLMNEGEKLWDEGADLYVNAVKEIYGSRREVEINWETGKVELL